MSRPIHRWMPAILLAALGAASAAPVLPAPSLAAQAVRESLAPDSGSPVRSATAARSAPVQAPRPAQPQTVRVAAPRTAPAAARPAQTQAASAAQVRARAVQQAQAARSTRPTGRTAVVRATAYNSLAAQTDSTPFITATGTRTRPGVVALSRDMLRLFPYGSKIMIEDLSGRYNGLLRGRVFSVEDTMAARKTRSLDIWMTTRSQALQFGARQVRITAVR